MLRAFAAILAVIFMSGCFGSETPLIPPSNSCNEWTLGWEPTKDIADRFANVNDIDELSVVYRSEAELEVNMSLGFNRHTFGYEPQADSALPEAYRCNNLLEVYEGYVEKSNSFTSMSGEVVHYITLRIGHHIPIIVVLPPEHSHYRRSLVGKEWRVSMDLRGFTYTRLTYDRVPPRPKPYERFWWGVFISAKR